MRRLAELARWFDTLWWCRCDYNNIATFRCYHCGSRPPRRLRAQLGAPVAPRLQPEPRVQRETVDA